MTAYKEAFVHLYRIKLWICMGHNEDVARIKWSYREKLGKQILVQVSIQFFGDSDTIAISPRKK